MPGRSDNSQDLIEIGRAVHSAAAALLQHEEVAFSATPVDIMGPDGMRRAFVMVTLDERVVQFLEQGLAIALEAQRKNQEGG